MFLKSGLIVPVLLTFITRGWTLDGNITIAFTSDQANTCDDHTESPGFTTSVVPKQELGGGACYNLEDIFSDAFLSSGRASHANVTRLAQSGPNLLNGSSLNSHKYDSQTNYSQVWYQQTSDINGGDSGVLALRDLTIYSEIDCDQEKGASYFQWNCRSDAQGSCSSLPERIVSFSIGSALPSLESHGKQTCYNAEAVSSAGTAISVQIDALGVAAVSIAIAVGSLL